MEDGSNMESDNAFKGSDDTIITNSDVDINDLNKLKAEVTALKMFTTDQLYLLKQSAGNLKHLSATLLVRVSFIKFLVEQINCLKEENKMKNSFNQSLLFQNSSTTFPND